jgi:hypothetical protein
VRQGGFGQGRHHLGGRRAPNGACGFGARGEVKRDQLVDGLCKRRLRGLIRAQDRRQQQGKHNG